MEIKILKITFVPKLLFGENICNINKFSLRDRHRREVKTTQFNIFILLTFSWRSKNKEKKNEEKKKTISIHSQVTELRINSNFLFLNNGKKTWQSHETNQIPWQTQASQVSENSALQWVNYWIYRTLIRIQTTVLLLWDITTCLGTATQTIANI